MANKKPLALIIMDGWGDNPVKEFNAVEAAKTPVLDSLVANYAHTDIQASGIDVGLPEGQMGNSEVGHTNIGAGRIVYQELTRIGKAIKDGDFFKNETLCKAVDKAVVAGKAVHIMGLMSPGGVHSHQDHIVAMIKLAAQRGAKKVYFHAFTDGRDVAPRSAHEYIAVIENAFKEAKVGRIATLVGRYYAMDRDNRWDRVQQAYDLLTQGKSQFGSFATADEALDAAYARDENDEFVKASVIGEKAPLEDGDSLIFMNFRADRARQITRSFVNSDADFTGFVREVKPKLASFVMLTQYAADIKTDCAYPPEDLTNTLGEWLSKKGMTQLRISETEKYAHVTFFFNGGRETPYEGEDRILVPSPKVATYDLKPEMSAYEVKDKLVGAIKTQEYDFIVVNFANGDMVGHTGIYNAIAKAVHAIDNCVKEVVETAKANDYETIIIADHGNADHALNEDGTPNTAHSLNPVPFIYVTDNNSATVKDGRLADVAPSILHILGMEQPADMTGENLIEDNK